MSNLNPDDINGLLRAMYPRESNNPSLITNDVISVPRNDQQPIQKDSNQFLLDAVKIQTDSVVTGTKEVSRIIQEAVDNSRKVFSVVSTDPRRLTWGKQSNFNGFSGQIVSGSPMPSADQGRIEFVEQVGKTVQGIANAPGRVLDDLESFMYIAGIGVVIFGGMFIYNQAKQTFQ